MKIKAILLLLVVGSASGNAQILPGDTANNDVQKLILKSEDNLLIQKKKQFNKLGRSYDKQIKSLLSIQKKNQSYLNDTNYVVKTTPEQILKDISVFLNYNSNYKTYLFERSQKLSEVAFEKIITPIYLKAIGGNDGVIRNGKVLTFDNNAEKSTIAINHYTAFKKNHAFILNYGINGKSDQSFLNIYNNGKYNYGIEGNIKLSKLHKSSILFDPKSIRKLRELRDTKCNYLLLAGYREIVHCDTAKLNSLITQLKGEINNNAVLKGPSNSFNHYKKLSDSLVVLNDSLEKVMQFYEVYTKKQLDDTIVNKVADFDVKNFKLNGHTIHWFDYDVSYQLKDNSIFDSTVYSTFKLKQKQFHKVTGGISYNYIINTKKFLFYCNVGVKVSNSYALEGKKIENFTLADTSGIQDYSFRGYNNLQDKNTNTTYLAVAPFFNAVIFPGEKKQFGIETGISISKQEFAANIFTGRFGLLYSLTNESDKDVSKTTIGLFFSLNKFDSSLLPNINESMSVGFRLGLPLEKLLK